ncbi:MAG: thymidine phosphorylase, partial [Actinomycetota bacterium]
MNAVDIIRTKRDGARLSDGQINWFIEAYTDGEVADEQAAALLMAIVWRGMEPEELAVWTAAMISSGERLDLSSIDRPTVDKHSTGGVGDKVSLPLAPLVAACGAADPMLSGRGLGHTGGTLDKLEAIPGYRVDLEADEMKRILAAVGCVICSAGPGLAPADRKLYALRDVTGTVESVPLIASSIMSKKIAEGTEALVLDVKVGSGAFLPDVRSARELAETMVELGTAHGVKTSAVLTDMDQPLGLTAGNGLEVTESVEVLSGKGPDDVVEITVAIADEMMSLVGSDADTRAALTGGRALERWSAMVAAQGGDPDAPPAEASERRTVPAAARGFVE